MTSKAMQVLRGGLVSEYTTGIGVTYEQHVQEQLIVLEKLDPTNGAALRARFNAVRRGGYVHGDHITKVAGAVSAALDKCAPDGMYFGIPHASNGCAGFWPNEWLNPHRSGVKPPTHAEARLLPKCVIG